MNREQAIEYLRASKLSAHLDVLVEMLRPSVRLHRRPVAIDEAPLGASRFGGPPDLPPEFAWPLWEVSKQTGFLRRKLTKTLVPLDFLAQINLAELSDLAPGVVPDVCPRSGMLYFFYDIDEEPWGFESDDALGFRVAYATDASQLVRQPGPPASKSGVPDPCVISAVAEWTLPEWSAVLGDDDELEDVYMEDVAPALYESEGDGGLRHRMFGYPQCIQDSEELWEGDDSRILLMQIDTDDKPGGSPGWMWGDVGTLYFTIPRDDFAKPDLTSIRMHLQCH